MCSRWGCVAGLTRSKPVRDECQGCLRLRVADFWRSVMSVTLTLTFSLLDNVRDPAKTSSSAKRNPMRDISDNGLNAVPLYGCPCRQGIQHCRHMSLCATPSNAEMLAWIKSLPEPAQSGTRACRLQSGTRRSIWLIPE